MVKTRKYKKYKKHVKHVKKVLSKKVRKETGAWFRQESNSFKEKVNKEKSAMFTKSEGERFD
jgi:hypothetical protein